MARYQFTTKELTVIVGWDNPLQTFFAQVWKGEPESAAINHPFPGIGPHPLLWLGTTRDDVPTVKDLAAGLKPHAEIPPDIVGRLREDFANRRPPTTAQEAWQVFVRRLLGEAKG